MISPIDNALVTLIIVIVIASVIFAIWPDDDDWGDDINNWGHA